MATTKELISFEYHTDSETGIHAVGEIDYNISVKALTDYLEKYGVDGRDEIVKMFGVLISKVHEYCRETTEPKHINGPENVTKTEGYDSKKPNTYL